MNLRHQLKILSAALPREELSLSEHGASHRSGPQLCLSREQPRAVRTTREGRRPDHPTPDPHQLDLSPRSELILTGLFVYTTGFIIGAQLSTAINVTLECPTSPAGTGVLNVPSPNVEKEISASSPKIRVQAPTRWAARLVGKIMLTLSAVTLMDATTGWTWLLMHQHGRSWRPSRQLAATTTISKPAWKPSPPPRLSTAINVTLEQTTSPTGTGLLNVPSPNVQQDSSAPSLKCHVMQSPIRWNACLLVKMMLTLSAVTLMDATTGWAWLIQPNRLLSGQNAPTPALISKSAWMPSRPRLPAAIHALVPLERTTSPAGTGVLNVPSPNVQQEISAPSPKCQAPTRWAARLPVTVMMLTLSAVMLMDATTG
ncbi:uncharacterized protein LOC129177923 [Dunckerocampus dactyliophorus]|uniref:uncharacterized protein LOC129177923 n=1 Tax=Dunckerocampus dactyliophorus TaxID=161453 RepID=UPI002407017E|nr:uncharacterized protein LOC129177923 [Dunckerocampus dactyliophorus]